MFNISLPVLMGLGLLAAAPATSMAASCGTMGFGESAGSITVEAFLEAINTELSYRPDAEKSPVKVELVTFGLG